jgi:N utilization substance protein B
VTNEDADDGSATPPNPPTGGDGTEKRKPDRRSRPNRPPDRARRPAAPGERRAAGGRRHLGRIVALQVLYEIDVTDHPPRDVLERSFEDQELLAEEGLPATEESAAVREHVERLVGGVLGLQEVIDPHIAAAAPAFPVAQLPAVDRNVLRLAIFELLRETDVPVKAAINEAVELAKRFGGENSGRFVNGVLGTVAERIGAEARREAGEAGRRGGGKTGRRDGGTAGRKDGR